MPRASVPTLLPLATYAKILGLDPLHFCQGASVVRPEPTCSDVWFQYDWQNGDRVSRETLAERISEAERDIANELGYWPAPVWIEAERHLYPHPRNIALVGYGLTAGLRYKTVKLNWGQVLAGGTRATTLLGTAGYALSDNDNDGFDEWTLFELTVPAGTSAGEVKAYFTEDDRTNPSSTGADSRWEVRPIEASVSGTTLTVTIRSWELLRPDLQEVLDAGVAKQAGQLTTGHAIDADQLENYVEELVFYRVYTDTEHQVLFGWGELACEDPACAYVLQDGCMRSHDSRRGVIKPIPATYTDGAFAAVGWAECVEPDYLWCNYRAGLLPLQPVGCEELDRYWAETIVMLATARLDRPICACTNVEMRVDKWRQDMAHIHSDSEISRSYQIDATVQTNPFGSRVGEYNAWRRINKGKRGRQLGQAVTV